MKNLNKMKVTIEQVKKDGASCNFCNKGVFDAKEIKLKYPYDTVISFTGERSGLKACICRECLEDLYTIAKLTEL